jgi:hypothetical protein
MIKFELLKDEGVLVVEPKSALTPDNFRAAAYLSDLGAGARSQNVLRPNRTEKRRPMGIARSRR